MRTCVKRYLRTRTEKAVEMRPQKAYKPGMSYVSRIIEAFGGVRPMARAISRPTSTVQSWKDRASIPDRYKPDVLSKAREAGIDIEAADFFPASPANNGVAP